MDVGCGHGLLGIYSLKKNANLVVFQDYNIDVLNICTKVNIQKNEVNNFELVAGDWDLLQFDQKYDVLLMSEVIYNEDNYLKIAKFIKKTLK